MAFEQLKIEGMAGDKRITEKSSRYYNDPRGFAVHHFAFSHCYSCKKPYFVGAVECAQMDDGRAVDRTALLCSKCQKLESVVECKKHGTEYLQCPLRMSPPPPPPPPPQLRRRSALR
jgi:hypothetical protein